MSRLPYLALTILTFSAGIRADDVQLEQAFGNKCPFLYKNLNAQENQSLIALWDLAMTPASERTPQAKQYWTGIKESESALLHASKEVTIPISDVDTFVHVEGAGDRKITDYDTAVLSLREGDSVILGNRKFRLGKFRGAGNTTHIWGIADEPTKVLLLPFLSSATRSSAWPSQSKGRYFIKAKEQYPKIYEMLPLSSAGKAPSSESNGLKVVEILEKDEAHHAYLVMGAVEGTEAADSYEKQLWRRARSLETQIGNLHDKVGPSWADDLEWIFQYETYENEVSRQRQVKKYKAFKRIQAVIAPTSGQNDVHIGQFVWDEALEDWVLVDWAAPISNG